MALVPQVVDAINIPVIAAGGIADGRGFNAAISLGAIGVQVGTCLLVAKECPVHQNYKNAVIKAKDIDTVVTGRSINTPVQLHIGFLVVRFGFIRYVYAFFGCDRVLGYIASLV